MKGNGLPELWHGGRARVAVWVVVAAEASSGGRGGSGGSVGDSSTPKQRVTLSSCSLRAPGASSSMMFIKPLIPMVTGRGSSTRDEKQRCGTRTADADVDVDRGPDAVVMVVGWWDGEG